jgi:5-methylcytosine-specific restriction endonuclease McrA
MVFFQELKRRVNYETRVEDGSYYEYARYRQAIAEDCLFRCVYCDSHEDLIGGRESMALDHFRPWGKKFKPTDELKFSHLKNEPNNLVHSCRVCNGYKWSHWPTEDPNVCFDHEKGWIEPFEQVRSDFFTVNLDGRIEPSKAPAAYQILKLRLNRPLLKKQREFDIAMAGFQDLEDRWKSVATDKAITKDEKLATDTLALFSAIKAIIIAR